MDYEEDYDFKPINFQFIGIILACFVIVGALFYPMITKAMQKPVEIKPATNNSDAIQIVYETITVMVTPIPDGKTYFASEYESGIRKLGRQFSFYRENATGYKDLSVHGNVYDYREMNYYNWFNPTDYKYYRAYPDSNENKFLFVFAYVYMDDVTGEDTRMWIPSKEKYAVQIGDMLYTPVKFREHLRIKELEEVFNSNDDSRIQYYGTNRLYSTSLEYSNSAGEYADELTWLKGGKSNKIDGYIVYEIPKSTKLEDIYINVNYFSFGNAQWKLSEH